MRLAGPDRGSPALNIAPAKQSCCAGSESSAGSRGVVPVTE